MALRSRTVGSTVAMALAVAGVAACQPAPPPVIPAITGLTTTYQPPYSGERGNGSLTSITLTSAHFLAVTCDADATLVINATPTQVKCNAMESLNITGTASADTVHVDLQTGPLVSVSLGGGNDRSYVAGRGMSTTDGGAGNDTIAAITVLPYGSFGQSVRELSELHGGPGNDTLTNLGWSGQGTIDLTGDDLIDFLGMTLDGGPGADVLHGSPVRPDLIVTDPYDTLDVQSGPGDVTLQGTDGPDTVVVDLNGNWGPRGTITTPDGVAHPLRCRGEPGRSRSRRATATMTSPSRTAPTPPGPRSRAATAWTTCTFAPASPATTSTSTASGSRGPGPSTTGPTSSRPTWCWFPAPEAFRPMRACSAPFGARLRCCTCQTATERDR